MAIRTLPAGYAARPATSDDAAGVARVIAATQAANGDRPDISAEEVLADWQALNLAEEAVVIAHAGGAIVACADVFNRRNVLVTIYGYVHPDHRGRGLGGALVDWGEAWATERLHLAPLEAQVAVQHYLRSTDAAARELLTGRGYAPVRAVYVMAIDLDGPPSLPGPVPGVALRTFVPRQDEFATFEAVEDAFRDMWGRPAGVYERWLALTEGERRAPGLWFVAEDAGSGQIVGAGLGKEVGGSGWIGTVGVRRGWRGRGLGLALLRALFGEFHRRGVRRVELSVDAESSTGAPRLYARAGMRVTREFLIHRRVLRPGVDLAVLRDDTGG